ncbi:MAG: hypothetical protein ABR538_04105 [Candidatus Binatia bacterium]
MSESRDSQHSDASQASQASQEGREGDTGTAERLLRSLGNAAVDPDTREALAELGQRARNVVEDLARQVRLRREAQAARTPADDAASAPDARSRPSPASMSPGESAGLYYHLEGVRVAIDEFADVLEGTVERLESIELQLGDPDAGVERLLGEGIERCERVLQGIEHRVEREAGQKRSPTATKGQGESGLAGARPVLVVVASSRRRARICLALEKQGLATVAAADLALALRQSVLHDPAIALLEAEGTPDVRRALLDEWKDHEDRGSLPPVAILTDEAAAGPSFAGRPVVRESHGEAAMAASLHRLVQQARESETAADRQGAS